MRLRKADLRRRVNAPLTVRFAARGLTSFAGLELVRRYCRSIDLAGRLRRQFSSDDLRSDFGLVNLVMVVLALLITGGRRLRHVMYLGDDPLVLRFCGLKKLPAARTMGRWLRRFSREQLERLQVVNNELVAATIRHLGLRRLTMDVDGTVVSTGMKVDWAFRGMNPHHRKVPSYYPVTAYEAQSGQIFRVKNRPGNIHDGKASLTFLRDLFDQVVETLGRGYRLEFRMDAAFFRQDVIRLLLARGAEFAIKVPFYGWVGLKELIQRRRRWWRVDGAVSCFETTLPLSAWGLTLRVVIYRKRVYHRTRKNFQLDLFDPADGTFEYSAIVTNKTLSGRNLWHFLNGRGSHEKAYGELKGGFAFATVPTRHYGANSAWQIFSILAFNLMRGFQMTTTGERRSRSRKRRPLYRLESIQSLRYHWLNRAAVLTRPNGYAVLDVGGGREVRRRFEAMVTALAEAA